MEQRSAKKYPDFSECSKMSSIELLEESCYLKDLNDNCGYFTATKNTFGRSS
jgi:hypothetical protein